MMSDTHLPGSCAACEPSNKEIFLIKTGELVLKGLNKSTFESILLKNLRYKLKPLGEFKLRKAQSTIYVEPVDSMFDMDIYAHLFIPVMVLIASITRRRCRYTK